MDPIKATIKKYYVSDDGTVSMGAVGITLLAPFVVAVMAKEMWPLSVEDLIKIATTLPALMATLGWYRKVGKK